jgi:hypothetical protein
MPQRPRSPQPPLTPERTFLVDLQSADGERHVHFFCMAPSQREAIQRSTCIYPDLRVSQITTDDGSRWVFPRGSAGQRSSNGPGRGAGRMLPPPAAVRSGGRGGGGVLLSVD